MSRPACMDVSALPLQRAVSVLVATRDARNTPHIARALGLQAAPRPDGVALLLDGAAAADTLADVQANGQVAVVFSEPSTHRSVQLKGCDARVEPAGAADAAAAQAYIARMTQEIGQLGFPPELVAGLFSHDPAGLRVLRFTPVEAYEQTPGPQAGEPLHPAARPA